MFSVSPTVEFTETDLTYVVRSQTSAIGGIAGKFLWGPADDPYFITEGETELITKFGKPSTSLYSSQLQAIDYLSYADQLWVNRAVGPNARCAVRDTAVPLYIRNDNEYVDAVIVGTEFLAKYVGALGNNLIVDVADAAKFNSNWEYARYFTKEPQPGEFAIVVLDKDGYFSGGLGATGQEDTLTIEGEAAGGIQQIEDYTFLGGPISGGVKQQEVISINGIATGVGPLVVAHTALVPGTVTTSMAIGDMPATIAVQMAADFLADPNFDSAVVINGSQVLVTYSDYLLHAKIADYSLDGITVTSVITTAGSNVVSIVVDGNNVDCLDTDTITDVATKCKAVMDLNPAYSAVTATAGVLNVTFAEPILRTVIGATSFSGVTGSSTIVTPGDAFFNFNYLGQVISLKNKDNAAVVAAKVAQAIKIGLPLDYDTVITNGSTIILNHAILGVQVLTAPQAMTLGIKITTSITEVCNHGDILEKYESVSINPGALYDDGSVKYYIDLINNKSNYIRVGDTTMPLANVTLELAGGVDDNACDLLDAFDTFVNAEQFDINFMFGASSVVEQQKMIDIAGTRRDCTVHISPMLSDLTASDILTEVSEWTTVELQRDSSYVFKTGNWGYVKDSYNGVWRWIPCASGTAGIAARMYKKGQPWFSVADADYGYYKNYAKLAWNPNKAQRDKLVKYQINPVVSFKGDGIRLFGDWTGTTKQSAFQFYHIRCLFIELEKAISTFAHKYLFKINDEITRATFLNAVRPYLRDIKAKRGMQDFRVVIDSRNNTSQRVMSGEMYADFMIKPLYSIRYIYLNFSAIRSDFTFDEVEDMLFT